MISGKGHDMICNLVSAAGKANDKEDLVKSWTQLEEYVCNLETALKNLYVASGTVANCAYNVGQSHEDWENIKQWIDKLDNARAIAIKVFQENK